MIGREGDPTMDAKTEILSRLNSECADTFDDFYTRGKCSHSPYFVGWVKDEIGRISFFDLDHELTKDEEAEILKAFFA